MASSRRQKPTTISCSMHIVSGGQTGADQGALDAAIILGLPYSGWIPAERWTEEGPLSSNYKHMQETESLNPAQRTEWNVRDSDGTLFFSHGSLQGGTLLAYQVASIKYHRPCLVIDFEKMKEHHIILKVRDWLTRFNIEKLNVAGPRKSEDPLIYDKVKETLLAILGNDI